jgi:hypothetical protein
MCKSCNYSQKAKIFKDTWRIDKANKWNYFCLLT